MISRMRIVHADGTPEGRTLYSTERSEKPLVVPVEGNYVKIIGSDALYVVTSVTLVIMPPDVCVTVMVEDSAYIEFVNAPIVKDA